MAMVCSSLSRACSVPAPGRMVAMSQAPPKLYTVEEATEILRCSRKTIRRRIQVGELVATKPPGARGWLIPETSLKAHVNAGVRMG